jgi:hypothetical protein
LKNNILPVPGYRDNKQHLIFFSKKSTVNKLFPQLGLSKDSNRQVVALESVSNKDVREIGTEWLSKQTLDQLKVNKLLKDNEWSEEQISLAYTHIISKATKPASELKTTRLF